MSSVSIILLSQDYQLIPYLINVCRPLVFLFVFFATFWKSKLAPLSARITQGYHCIIVKFQFEYEFEFEFFLKFQLNVFIIRRRHNSPHGLHRVFLIFNHA